MATQVAFPGTVTQVSSAPESAEAWVNPGSVSADDGNEASITAATFDSPDVSQRLVCANFGFTIPIGSTINGITVEIEKRDGAIGTGLDNRVQLQDASAALVGTNKADTVTDWPTNATIISYGGAADTWTASPTPTMVNDPDFGVVISAKANAANTDVFIDFVRITITYTPPPDVPELMAGSRAGTARGMF